MFSEDENLALKTVVTVVSALIATEEADGKKRRKRPREWVRPYYTKRQNQGYHENLLKQLRLQDPDFYRRFLRMGVSTFEYLLQKVGPRIQKQDTRFRKSIRSSEMLEITLRHMATGESQWSLGLQFRIGQRTISKFIPQVCSAIYEELRGEYLTFPSSPDEWKKIALGFEKSWNFPHCIGALDGKHIEIQKPPNSGSEYYNYKKYFSIVMMALVDADLKFIYVDVGSAGRISDGGIWGKCRLQRALSQSQLGIPAPEELPGTLRHSEKLPFVIVGDEAFPLSENLMRPFSGQDQSVAKQIFNYRLSRARRTSENGFGILASQWRILRTSIMCNLETVDKMILAMCSLHNMLRCTEIKNYTPGGSVDFEDIQGCSFTTQISRSNS